MSNFLRVIFPYKDEGQWMFDDAATGLVREPFVYGIDTMLDLLTKQIPGAERGVKALFSDRPFPQSIELVRVREELGGQWYRCPVLENMEGWLCPALFKYFAEAPERIYVKLEPKQA